MILGSKLIKYDLVILAAGLGSRLKSLTLIILKAMVKYKGKKFIEIQINNIDKNYINKFIVVTGYKSSILKKFLKKNSQRLNLNIFITKILNPIIVVNLFLCL
jgi:choline kinase